MRSGVLAQLEDMRDETVSDRIVQLQAICRGYLGRKKLERMHVRNKHFIFDNQINSKCSYNCVSNQYNSPVFKKVSTRNKKSEMQ